MLREKVTLADELVAYVGARLCVELVAFVQDIVCADNLGNRRGLAHMQGVCWTDDLCAPIHAFQKLHKTKECV
jgi:hypothetical protein